MCVRVCVRACLCVCVILRKLIILLLPHFTRTTFVASHIAEQKENITHEFRFVTYSQIHPFTYIYTLNPWSMDNAKRGYHHIIRHYNNKPNQTHGNTYGERREQYGRAELNRILHSWGVCFCVWLENGWTMYGGVCWVAVHSFIHSRPNAAVFSCVKCDRLTYIYISTVDGTLRNAFIPQHFSSPLPHSTFHPSMSSDFAGTTVLRVCVCTCAEAG